MRRNFVFFVLVPSAVLLLVVYLFVDRWIESGLEYAGEKIVGAKVEVDNLRVTLSPIGLEFSRLQVANPRDPWKNVFETGRVKFGLDFAQLLRSKFIIETMEVNNLILATKRTTNGSLGSKLEPQPGSSPAITTDSTLPAPGSIAEQASPAMRPEKKKTPVFDLDRIKRELKVDSLLDPKNLRTYRLVDSLEQQVRNADVQWQAGLADLDKSKQRLPEIEANVKSINVGEIKSLEAAKAAFENAKNASNGIGEIASSFKERKAGLTDGVNKFSGSLKEIDDVAKQDFQSVVSLARLPDVSMKGLAELVLGKEILTRAYSYLYWVDFARDKVPQYTPKPGIESPRRSEGQNVRFPLERSYPKLWIKKIVLSGGTDKAQDPEYFYAKGEVLNITDDQRTTGAPLTIALEATKGKAASMSFQAAFDRRKDEPLDTYKATLQGLTVSDMALGRSDFLPSKLTGANAGAAIGVEVPGNRFEANTRIDFSSMKLLFDREPSNTVERIVRDVLASTSSFTVNLRMWKTAGRFDVAFATDLDDQIASRTKKVVGDEIARIRNDLRSKFDARIAEKRREFETLLNGKKDEVMGRLKAYEGQVNEKSAMVESKKKEIENRMEEEKKKQTEGLKKKAEETIKGIFKKN